MKKYRKKDIPPEIQAHFGKTLQAITRTADGHWLAAGFAECGVWEPETGELHAYPWVDFARGTYRGESAQLRLTFIDEHREPLSFTAVPDEAAPFIAAMLERIDDSIVYQEFAELAAGQTVSAQMRRKADGTLFAQVPWESARSAEDRAILAALEHSVKEAVGV
ncbi:MAG: hypothetical protein PT944_01310 [Actinomycetaceae bacterium]|nr:hypothetical protein [Arcanobacterium sp.]MDD7686542.1 hypothetical protein [Actinomycetaceae bacterium]MDY5272822.1 hypothetical protein [Arcanobacterium sp.]